ncbi:hypothetical protein [Dactylosporangium sp. NPDC049140]|uniref:hypothetical protein n=1 Tax=Dactylosporangium sp. NPDC049140 TaxID=3155647 RepID=UPI0033D2B833
MNPLDLLAILLCLCLPLVTGGYLALCRIAPFRRCRTCGGTGLARRQFGRVSRPCRRCDATGLRIRYGIHLINELRRIHRDGNR